jgi:hypothetical protein
VPHGKTRSSRDTADFAALRPLSPGIRAAPPFSPNEREHGRRVRDGQDDPGPEGSGRGAIFLMTLAGTPPTMVWSGTSLVTTELAATTQRFPMLTPAITATLYPMRVFDPMWTGSGIRPLWGNGTEKSS